MDSTRELHVSVLVYFLVFGFGAYRAVILAMLREPYVGPGEGESVLIKEEPYPLYYLPGPYMNIF